MKAAIYPGSFDPVTNGHIDIINRASKLFDKIYVCIAINPNKKSFFTDEEKIYMMKEACKNIKNVEVICTNDLIVREAKRLSCQAIIRGLRAVTDFEYEFQLAAANEYLDKDVEMIFMMASTGKGFISSSSIKEFVDANVDIKDLVPQSVVDTFNKKLRK